MNEHLGIFPKIFKYLNLLSLLMIKLIKIKFWYKTPTMILDSFPFHTIYIDIVGMLYSKNSIDTISTSYPSLTSINWVWSRTVAILWICCCHLWWLWEVAYEEEETKWEGEMFWKTKHWCKSERGNEMNTRKTLRRIFLSRFKVHSVLCTFS